MIPILDTSTATRDEWLAARTRGIGGSDAAAVCGLSRWSSPMTVWLEKTGQLPPKDETEAMRWGRRLEQAVADEFADTTGWEVHNPHQLAAHDDHPWMLATPDRTYWTGTTFGVLEIKTTDKRMADDWADDEVPADALMQTLHYLAVTGFPEAHIAVLIGGNRYHHTRIDADDDLIGQLIDIEARFWHDHVLTGTPPPADPSQATADALADLYAHVHHDQVQPLDPGVALAVAELHDLKAEEKDLADRKRGLENVVKAALGPAEVGEHDGVPVVTWKSTTRRNLPDNVAASLACSHEDPVDDFNAKPHSTTYRRLHLPKPKTARRAA